MNELLEAYPLTWPEHQPRTPASRQKIGHFKVTFWEAVQDLRAELARMGGSKVIISTNIRLRNDGLPRSDEREPTDPGVAAYFERKGKPFVIACDTYNRVKHNTRAIGLTVDALRAIERHASTQMMEQAFRGFTALPAYVAEASWWDVLGVSPEATVEQIDQAWKRLAEKHHPDRGGSHDEMARVNRARDVALEERR